MIPQQLSDYIKRQLERGVLKEDIRKVLLEAGWPEKTVDEGFAVPDRAALPLSPQNAVPVSKQPQNQPVRPQTQNFVAPAVAEPQKSSSVMPTGRQETTRPFAYAQAPQDQPVTQPSASVVARQNNPWPKVIAGIMIILLMGGAIGAGYLYHRWQYKKVAEEPELVDMSQISPEQATGSPANVSSTSPTETQFSQLEPKSETASSSTQQGQFPVPKEPVTPPSEPAAKSQPANNGLSGELQNLLAYEKTKNNSSLSEAEINDATLRDDMITLGFFLQLYYSKNGVYPESLADLASLGYYTKLGTVNISPFAYALTNSGIDYKMCVNYEMRGYLCFESDSTFKKSAAVYMRNLK